MRHPDIPNTIVTVEPVGSRVTCNPAPTDTDADFLCLVTPAAMPRVVVDLDEAGFALGGSIILDDMNYTPPEDRFGSWKKGEVNVILTSSPIFFRRFLAATAVAKRLNLLDKADRVALFQAVLYGNDVTIEPIPFEDRREFDEVLAAA